MQSFDSTQTKCLLNFKKNHVKQFKSLKINLTNQQKEIRGHPWRKRDSALPPYDRIWYCDTLHSECPKSR